MQNKNKNFQTFPVSLLCSLILSNSIAVPQAHAGVWSFFKHHLSHHEKTDESIPNAGEEALPSSKESATPSDSMDKTSDGAASTNQPAAATTTRTTTKTAITSDAKVKKTHKVATEQKTASVAHPSALHGRVFQTIASWYGRTFQGKRTASGKKFDGNGLTAASKTLPFGTRLNVSNPSTGKSCTVTVTDRGPFVKGRGLDLSSGAARKIGLKGVAPVVCKEASPVKDGAASADAGATKAGENSAAKPADQPAAKVDENTTAKP